MSFNKRHPEMGDDEFFCMNIPEFALEWVMWDTKRLGSNAYNDHGESLPDLKPLFVKREEVIDKYGEDHASKVFGNNPSSETRLLN